MVLIFVSADEIPKCDHSMKSTEHFFPVMLLTMRSKVVLTFESADEILKCRTIQMKATVKYHETLYNFAVRGDSNVCVYGCYAQV